MLIIVIYNSLISQNNVFAQKGMRVCNTAAAEVTVEKQDEHEEKEDMH